MPLAKACLVPHSPLLIPEIGKENTAILAKTSEAFAKLAEEFKASGVETAIVISPHGPSQDRYFTINTSLSYAPDFSEFGLLGASCKFAPDLGLTQKVKAAGGSLIQSVSGEKLDYGASVPLCLLSAGLPDLKIIPISYANCLSREEYWEFGQRLKEIIAASPKKIALIASGDLSPRLKKNSPAGYSPKGAKFDNRLIEILNGNEQKASLMGLDSKLVEDAGACGFKSVLVLLGALENTGAKAQVLSYQTDFGIGYLVMDFDLE